MVHEDPSTEATQKLPKERMFRKKSKVNPIPNDFSTQHSNLHEPLYHLLSL
ncbi:MAG: hypothetical protein LBJ16_00955 [Holosporaceae bacterium]|nr:hypothetical protein [Holosporaceae bacterium]